MDIIWLIILESSSTGCTRLFLKLLSINFCLCLQWNSPSVVETSITTKYNHCFPLWILQSGEPFELVVNLRDNSTSVLHRTFSIFTSVHKHGPDKLSFNWSKHNKCSLCGHLLSATGQFQQMFHWTLYRNEKEEKKIVHCLAAGLEDNR